MTPLQSILETTEVWKDGEQVSGCQGRRDLGVAIKGHQRTLGDRVVLEMGCVGVDILAVAWCSADLQMSPSGRLGTGH